MTDKKDYNEVWVELNSGKYFAVNDNRHPSWDIYNEEGDFMFSVSQVGMNETLLRQFINAYRNGFNDGETYGKRSKVRELKKVLELS